MAKQAAKAFEAIPDLIAFKFTSDGTEYTLQHDILDVVGTTQLFYDQAERDHKDELPYVKSSARLDLLVDWVASKTGGRMSRSQAYQLEMTAAEYFEDWKKKRPK